MKFQQLENRRVLAAIANGEVVTGDISIGETDSFEFDLDADQLVRISVADLQTAGTSPEPVLEVFEPFGAQLNINSLGVEFYDASDSDDAFIQFRAREVGEYTARVREESGSDVMDYQVRLVVVDDFTTPTEIPGQDETLSNGEEFTSTLVAAGINVHSFVPDGDLVRISLGELTASGSSPAPFLQIVDSNGQVLEAGADVQVFEATDDDDAVIQFIPSAPSQRYHAIVTEASNSQTLDYRIRFVGLAGTPSEIAGRDQALESGDSFDGTLPAGGINLHTIATNNGDFVRISVGDLQVGSSSSVPVLQVVDASGNLLTDQSSGVQSSGNTDDSAFIQFASLGGEYTAMITEASNSEALDYRIRAVVVPGTVNTDAAVDGPLANGTEVESVVDVGGMNVHQFEGAQGETIRVSVGDLQALGSNSPEPFLQLIDPDGDVLASDSPGVLMFDETDSDDAFVQFTVETAGTFTALVHETSNNKVLDYRIRMVKSPDAPELIADRDEFLESGEQFNATVPVGGVNVHQFSAEDGNFVTLSIGDTQLAGTSPSPFVHVLDPDGFLLTENSSGIVDFDETDADDAFFSFDAMKTGDYTVWVTEAQNSEELNYDIRVVTVPNTPVLIDGRDGVIANGQELTRSLPAAGINIHPFEADAGDFVRISLGDLQTAGDSPDPTLQIVSPAGSLLTGASSGVQFINSIGNDSAFLQFTANATGTYTALVGEFGNSDQLDYSIRLVTLPGMPELSAGLDEMLDNGEEALSNVGVGSMNLHPITINAGDLVRISVGDLQTVGTDPEPFLQIVDPNGVRLTSTSPGISRFEHTSADDAVIEFRANEAGVYTAIVTEATLEDDLAYRIRAVSLPGTPALLTNRDAPLDNGDEVESLLPIGGFNTHALTAGDGDFVRISVGDLLSSGSSPEPRVQVVAPSGVVVAEQVGVNNVDIQFSASETGDYTIVVSDDSNSAALGYRIRALTAPGTATLLSGRDQVLANGQESVSELPSSGFNLHPFDVEAGAFVRVAVGDLQSAGSSPEPSLQILSPDGSPLMIGSAGVQEFNQSSSNNAFIEFLASEAGTYTAVVSEESNVDAMDYRIRFATLPGTPDLLVGRDLRITDSTTSISSLPVGGFSLVRFEATTGNSVDFRVEESAGSVGEPAVKVFSPTGTLVSSGTDPAVTSLTFSAPADGLYTALVTDSLNDEALPFLVTVTGNSIPTRMVTVSEPAQSANEDAGLVTFEIQLSGVAATDVVVPFTISGEATNGDDFTITPSPVTIAAGTISETVSVTIVDDLVDDDDETIVVTLGTPTGAVTGTDIVHTISIVDNDDPAPNLAPSFTAVAPPAISAGAGEQTIVDFATFDPGAGEDTQMVLAYTVTANDATQFSAGPAIDNTGTLTYTIADGVTGPVMFSVTVQDDGGTANGGVDTSASQTFTITVNELVINQAPTFTAVNPPAISAGSGAQTITDFATFDPGNGEDTQIVLAYTATANDATQFSAGPAIDNTGTLTYTIADGVTGPVMFSVTVQDDGGTANGGVDTSASQTFTITVNELFVNQAPSFTAVNPPAISADAGAQTITDFAAFNPGTGEDTQMVLAYTVTANDATQFSSQPAIDNTGTLTYTIADGVTGPIMFSVTVQDDGGTANGGVDTSASQTFTITVNELFVNQAPTFTAVNPPAISAGAGAQTIVDFATFDPGTGEDTQIVLAYTATANDSTQFSSQPAIDNTGTLTYTIADGVTGPVMFSVTVQDDGGTANGGVDTSASQTFTITVNELFVNQAPTFTAVNPPAISAGAGAQTITDFAAFNPGTGEDTQIVLAYTATANEATQFSSQPAIDNTGTLTYTVADGVTGPVMFSVTVQDDGGTGNGGVDTSASQTFTITVNELVVNQAPSFTAVDALAILINAGAQTVTGFAAFDPGAGEDTQMVLAYTATANDATQFSSQPAIDNSGNLTYTVADGVTGTITFTAFVQDDGGTENGGVDTSATQTFSIIVTEVFVNQAPSFTAMDPPAILAGAGEQTVTGFATFDPGASEDTQMVLGYTVTATDTTQFSTQPAIDNSGNLTYTVADEVTGMITFTVTVQDDGGTANGGVDTSQPQSFTITVNELFVNQAPLFIAVDPPAIDVNAGPQTIANFADFEPGNGEDTQMLVGYTVTATNPAQFSVQPVIDNAGTLTYTVANDVTGMITFSATAQDDGGTANGGVDTSDSLTFTITVNELFVNQAPSFTAVPPPTIAANAGAQTITNFASFNPGAGEATQSVLAYVVTATDPTQFASLPAIDNSGTLTYTVANDVTGAITFSATVQDDGGTANGGVDTSPPQTFTITVADPLVNQAPSFTANDPPAVEVNAGAQTITNFAIFNAGAGENTQSVLGYTVVASDTTRFSVQPVIDNSGTLTYTVADDITGSFTFTATVRDNGGTANGGVDTSDPQTFTITVNEPFVNLTPSFAAVDPPAIAANAGVQTVTNFATFNPGSGEDTQVVLAYTVAATDATQFSVQPAIDNAGTLTYTVADGVTGMVTFTATVQDDGGTANGGVDTSASQTFTITVNELVVNQAPSFTAVNPPAILVDAGAQTVTSFATFDPGTGEEMQSVLAYTVTASDAAQFSVPPAIDTAGTLTYTVADGVTGSVMFSVTVQDDGGTANGGIDTSPSQTFAITVGQTPVVVASAIPAGTTDLVLPKGDPPTSWARQRSSLRVVEFTLPTALTRLPTGSELTLTNRGIGGAETGSPVTIADDQVSLSSDNRTLTLDLPSGLEDGVYELVIAGDVNGGTPITISGSLENGLYVLKGDWNGDGIVTAEDFPTFAYWFENVDVPEYVDLRDPVGINGQDFTVFLNNFGKDLFPDAQTSSLQVSSEGEGELQSLMRTLLNPADVNGDGSVSAADALNVVNEIARNGSGVSVSWSKYDANSDGQISARDALHVINRLPNSVSGVQAPVAESESVEDTIEETPVDEIEATASPQNLQSFGTALDSELLDAVMAERPVQADSADSEGGLADTIELLSSDQNNR